MTDYTCRKDRKNMTSTYDPVSRIHGSFSTSGKAPGMADYYMCRIKENGKISISSDSALIHGNLSLSTAEDTTVYRTCRSTANEKTFIFGPSSTVNRNLSLSEAKAIVF